jgi:hypothetical protein
MAELISAARNNLEVYPMIVLVEATYPGKIADEVATKFLDIMKNDPLPDYVKIIDMYAFAAGDGIRVLLFYDVGTGKEQDGFKYIATGVVEILRTVEGYRAEVRPVYNMVEAFEFLGMNAPAA